MAALRSQIEHNTYLREKYIKNNQPDDAARVQRYIDNDMAKLIAKGFSRF
jgi:hypothetical protein